MYKNSIGDIRNNFYLETIHLEFYNDLVCVYSILFYSFSRFPPQQPLFRSFFGLDFHFICLFRFFFSFSSPLGPSPTTLSTTRFGKTWSCIPFSVWDLMGDGRTRSVLYSVAQNTRHPCINYSLEVTDRWAPPFFF